MRKMIIGGLAAGMLLAGCSESTPGTPVEPDSPYKVVHVRVDGRGVTCVVYDGYKEGGISCDWVSAGKAS